MKRSIQTICIVFYALSLSAFGATYTVDDDGPADFSNIYEAVHYSPPGNTIIIKPGIYKGAGNRDVDPLWGNLVIRSVDPNDPNIVAQTIIDCNGTSSQKHRGFNLYRKENSGSVIAGLTIINGYHDLGGGIYCNVGGNYDCSNCSFTIKNCIIRNNHASNYGGGIFCNLNNTLIVGCQIVENNADNGGGISCAGNVIVDGCKIDKNESSLSGGGIYCDTVSIKNCIISRNRTRGDGGGINSLKASSISNCEIIGNSSYGIGGGIYGQGTVSNCTIVANYTQSLGGGVGMGVIGIGINNSIIWGNFGQEDEYSPGSSQIFGGSPRYSCVQYDNPDDSNNPFKENGTNIFDNPQFVRMPDDGGDGFGDNRFTPEDEGANDDLGDLHIKINSPCINKGMPNFDAWPDKTDIDGDVRIAGGRVDIGADEYLPIIAVTKPIDGEIWEYGSLHTIEWVSTGCDQDVDMLFSMDGGNIWYLAGSFIDNTGSYKWYCPDSAFDSNNCLIKIVPSIPDSNVLCIPSGHFTVLKEKLYPDSRGKWSGLGGDFTRRGLSQYSGPQLGCVKWVFDTNGPVTSSASIGEDGTIYAACEDGNLYAIDSNGTLIWKYETNDELISSPSLGTDGTIFVGGRNGILYAIDKDGNPRWTHSTDGWIYSSPAVAKDGKVFVGSMDGKLYAFGPDGSELWQFQTSGYGVGTTGSIIASPAIDSNGTIYLMSLYEPNLYAIDPNNGSIKWACNLRETEVTYQPYGLSSLSPIVGKDGTIYVVKTYDPNLYAIEPINGNIKWTVNLADPCSPWFGPEFSNKVYVFKTSWRLGKWYKTDCFSEPVIAPDGTIYVSFDDPFLRAVDPNGSIKWVTRLGMVGGFTMSVGSDGLIYAASDDGHLYIVDSSGNEISRFITDDMLSWPVLSEDGNLIVSDSNNRIWFISLSDCISRFDLHRPEDLFGDGVINFYDIAILAQNWLGCTDRYLSYTLDGPPRYRKPDGKYFNHCNYTGDEIYFPGDVDMNLYIDKSDFVELISNWLGGRNLNNIPPSVSLISPNNGDIYLTPCVVQIEVDARDSDGSVQWVEFFFNGQNVGADTDGSDGWSIAYPFQVDWGNPSLYIDITARAVDNEYSWGISKIVKISVLTDPPME